MESYTLGPARGVSVKSNLTVNFEQTAIPPFATTMTTASTTLGKRLPNSSDFHTFIQRQTDRRSSFIRRLVEKQIKVHVYCNYGKTRFASVSFLQ